MFTGIVERTVHVASVSEATGFVRLNLAIDWTDIKPGDSVAVNGVCLTVANLDLPLVGFDSSCPAMAQGPTRLARGQAFGKFVNQKFGAHHTVTVVPLCGHNARCMFTAEVALPLLFPKP